MTRMPSRRASPEGARALAFVRQHGIVLASARGPVPSLAEYVAGAPIRGSWWAHPRGREIFLAISTAQQAPEVLTCRLVAGRLTFVHERLWPALVRASSRFAASQLARVSEEHTPSGRHASHAIVFPDWVPARIQALAARLSEAEALKLLGEPILATGQPSPRPRRTRRIPSH